MRQLAEAMLQRAFPVAVQVRRLWRRIVRPVTIGVRALVVQDGQVLLIRPHGSDRWALPGGGVKRGESLRAAAEREAREETGCDVRAERLLGLYLSIHEGMTNHVAVYVCGAQAPPRTPLNVEIAEARFWPIDALPPLSTPDLPSRLREYAAGAEGLDGRW